MSADFYFKVVPATDEVKKKFDRMSRVDAMMGSFDPEIEYRDDEGFIRFKDDPTLLTGMLLDEWDDLRKDVFTGDQKWVGEVSWAKAGDTQDEEKWVPRSVANIDAIFGGGTEVLTITPQLVTRIMVAMNQQSNSHYEKRHRAVKFVNDKRVPMLDRHGKQPIGTNIYSATRGVASRRDVKKWLVEHMGQTIVVASE